MFQVRMAHKAATPSDPRTELYARICHLALPNKNLLLGMLLLKKGSSLRAGVRNLRTGEKPLLCTTDFVVQQALTLRIWKMFVQPHRNRGTHSTSTNTRLPNKIKRLVLLGSAPNARYLTSSPRRIVSVIVFAAFA